MEEDGVADPIVAVAGPDGAVNDDVVGGLPREKRSTAGLTMKSKRGVASATQSAIKIARAVPPIHSIARTLFSKLSNCFNNSEGDARCP